MVNKYDRVQGVIYSATARGEYRGRSQVPRRHGHVGAYRAPKHHVLLQVLGLGCRAPSSILRHSFLGGGGVHGYLTFLKYKNNKKQDLTLDSESIG